MMPITQQVIPLSDMMYDPIYDIRVYLTHKFSLSIINSIEITK